MGLVLQVMFKGQTFSTSTLWPLWSKGNKSDCALASWLARFADCIWGTHQLR